MLLKNCLLAAM